MTASDGNVLACFWEDNKDANPDFKLMTVPTGNDNVRLAVQHAVARATGGVIPTETAWAGPVFEDSTDPAKPVTCRTDLPGGLYLSAEMSGEAQAELLK